MPGKMSGSQITDELLAAADQQAPIAVIPLNDPMTQLDNQPSAGKTNAFRIGVDQPLLGTGRDQNASTPANYCKHMMQVGMKRIQADEKQFSNFATPDDGTGTNLFTFLAARLAGSFDNLGCGALLNAPDPVNLTLDANGVATAATFSALAIGTLPGGVEPSATATAAPAASATGAPTATTAPTATGAPTVTGAPTEAPADPATGAPTPAPTQGGM
jgi:hypothetical protein